MLKIETIIRSARTESNEGRTNESKTLTQTTGYRAPRVIEVGKASQLLQGWAPYGYRDASNFYCVP